MFVGLGVSGVLPICQAVGIYGYSSLNERMGLNWVLLQGFLYIFGAFLYAVGQPTPSCSRIALSSGAPVTTRVMADLRCLMQVRWPERSAPRTFDIWGSSHQIFHVLILLAAAAHLKGMTLAFDHHHSIMGAQC